MEAQKINKIEGFAIFTVVIACSAILVFGFVYYMYFSHFPILTNNNEHWGQFGDYVGGTLNSVFTFFTFLSILYTVYLQRKELRLNVEELQLNRKEQQRANDEARLQNHLSEQQLLISIKQKNEEFLLGYMKFYRGVENELKHTNFTEIGTKLLLSFMKDSKNITVTSSHLDSKGVTLKKHIIFQYLYCLEYLIKWDCDAWRNQSHENLEAEHLWLKSEYAPLLKAFCPEENFSNLFKSGIIDKLKVSEIFPNIQRFLSAYQQSG